jgi:hypothetical protein
LAKAMIEPEKVIAPIASAERHLDQAPPWMCAGACRCRRLPARRSAAAATNTAARPTSEWKAATSCGSAVIWMRLRDDGADGAADGDAER